MKPVLRLSTAFCCSGVLAATLVNASAEPKAPCLPGSPFAALAAGDPFAFSGAAIGRPVQVRVGISKSTRVAVIVVDGLIGEPDGLSDQVFSVHLPQAAKLPAAYVGPAELDFSKKHVLLKIDGRWVGFAMPRHTPKLPSDSIGEVFQVDALARYWDHIRASPAIIEEEFLNPDLAPIHAAASGALQSCATCSSGGCGSTSCTIVGCAGKPSSCTVECTCTGGKTNCACCRCDLLTDRATCKCDCTC